MAKMWKLNERTVKRNIQQRISKYVMPALLEQVQEDSNKYIPVRAGGKGALQSSATNSIEEGYRDYRRHYVVWRQPYARVMYRGYRYVKDGEGGLKKGKAFKYGKSPNPNARKEWFLYAKKLKLKDWLKLARRLYNRKARRG